MSVYVDKPRHKYGRMVMCHMLADTTVELNNMADKIGVNRKWFQSRASTPHYDICKAKRKIAVEQGAIELSFRELGELLKRLKRI